MNLGGLTREHKLLISAGAMVLYVISLFLDYSGEAGRNDLDGWWLLLVIAVLAAAVFAADALNFELPPIASIAAGTYMASLLLFDAVLNLFQAPDHALGYWLALITSAVATALSWMVWREDR